MSRERMSGADPRKVVATRFNPQRLDLARRRHGWSRVTLAREIGLSSRMVRAYMQEGRQPSVETLEQMAERLGFPRAFFEADELDEVPMEGTSFRALSRLTAKERDQASAVGQIGAMIAAWIDERFNLPQPDIPAYEGVDPDTASLALRQRWGIGVKPVAHMIGTAEAFGVRVFSIPHECDSVDAFSFRTGQVPFIFLNTKKSAERVRMDVAHELGHLVLHAKDKPHGRREEYEAAQFGSALLMPRESVVAYAPLNGTLKDIIAAKARWRVSAAALTYRMHKVGMLSDWRYRKTFAYLSREGYRTSEPEPIGPEKSHVLEQVLGMLRDDGMSRADLAGELLISASELSRLCFGMEVVPEEPSGGAQGEGAVEGLRTDAAARRRRLQSV